MGQRQEDYETAVSDGGWSEPYPRSANPPGPFIPRYEVPGRYEYRVIKLYYAIFEAEAAIAALLNIEGDEGWYLCAVDGGFAFMRREVGPRSERELIERLEPR